MNRALVWFAGNGVAANLLMLVIVVGGLLTLLTLKMEIFPEISSGRINVTVEYPGAAPEEVEEGICVRIEEELQDIEGLKKLTSSSAEGLGTVTVELMQDADLGEALDEVKTRVDAIDTFPEEAEKPVIEEVITRRQVINVAIAGDTDERSLKILGEQIRDELSSLPGITQVKLANARPFEISIEVSEEALRRHGLTFDAIARAIRQSSLDLPGGSLETRGGDILIRTKGQAYRGPDFERLVLLTRTDGTRLTVGDVARVVDGFRDTDQVARFNSERSVLVQVYRVGEQNALDIADAVKRYIDRKRAALPDGISLTVWQDNSLYLRSRRDLLLKNAFYGLILVFLILALFLRFRLAVWVTIGIPVSFLGAIWLMPGLDVSVNMISLFAFILVLGIVVDDAIVVGESIYTQQRRSGHSLEAAIRGVHAVAMPVIFAVLTSVAAMAPLLNVSGTTGEIMRVIPLIFIPALLFSLVESLLVLPSHLSHIRGGHDKGSSSWNPLVRFQRFFARSLERFIERAYKPFLEWALEWRYLTLAAGLTTLVTTLGLVLGGRVEFIFFPRVDADYISAMLSMPQGSPVETTAAGVKRLEDSAREVEAEILALTAGRGESPFRHVLSSVGEQPQRAIQALNAGRLGLSFTGGHLGEVTIELSPAEERSIDTFDLVQRWRDRTGTITGARELTFNSSLFSPGQAIEIELSHEDLDVLQEATASLKEALASYSGVYNLSDSYEPGKMEVKLGIRPEAESLGLTLADVARQVRQGFYGEEAQRVQRGRDDIRVMVRYPEKDRESLGDLESMRIRTPDGREVPFSAVAMVKHGRGYATIRRADRMRTITITGDVDETRGNANRILDELRASTLPDLARRHRGLKYAYEGQRREQQQTIRELATGFSLALFMIYALLAIPFRSYLQPFLVLSAIPFGMVGAVWGHLILGESLTILSMFGLVALTGVVVNDSLVLVDYVNRHRNDGKGIMVAVREGGADRFRPILLTSLTTFGGLTPLLLERSVQARFLIPMAITLGFGVIFATFITLVLVPAAYHVLEDIKGISRRWSRRRPGSGESSPPSGRAEPAKMAAPPAR